jgi:hypothetical protein
MQNIPRVVWLYLVVSIFLSIAVNITSLFVSGIGFWLTEMSLVSDFTFPATNLFYIHQILQFALATILFFLLHKIALKKFAATPITVAKSLGLLAKEISRNPDSCSIRRYSIWYICANCQVL